MRFEKKCSEWVAGNLVYCSVFFGERSNSLFFNSNAVSHRRIMLAVSFLDPPQFLLAMGYLIQLFALGGFRCLIGWNIADANHHDFRNRFISRLFIKKPVA